MGVPGFYSWLIRRYPLIKHMVQNFQLPSIDYLYLDMNGIIYKCVKDDSVIFKSQILPKQMEKIWLEVFNYINMIVNLLKPNKMLVMALDGVAPRSKMNNQRARRFKSARDHQKFMQTYYGFTQNRQSQQNFKNNSISPGTKFMQQLNKNIDFFIKKKIQQDDYWKNLSVVFTGSDVPGQGEHKIMQFIRANHQKFHPEDNHCLYGADADLIMLSMTLPLKNLCIIREQYIHEGNDVKIIKSKQKKAINFQIIFVSILRQYFQLEYKQLQPLMKVKYDLKKIIADFVFLFFFIGNDFLPRCMAYNIRQSSIQYLIIAFKQFLKESEDYVTGGKKINILALILLAKHVSQYQQRFIQDKVDQFEKLSSSKTDFETELARLMKAKVNNQKQFLMQLKASYLNQTTQGKQRFYIMKFGINPSTDINQYYSILYTYLYGLQFVYEYYFTLLPSWQWYYPYYYAPLLSDLYYYLTIFIQTGSQIQNITPYEPSEPFKQLMCILPKQSAQLLPQPFQEYLLSEQSPLRSPFDYYPDQFQDDMYGSTRSFEAVSLIPFLDLNLINQVYDKAIKQTSEEDQRRNRPGSSILYQFNIDGNQIQIESQFPLIKSARCTISIQYVSLRQQLNWKTQKSLPDKKQGLFRMPSLQILEFKKVQSISLKNKTLTLRIQRNQQTQNKMKIGSEVFYGYPLQHSGKIQAVLSLDKFLHLKQFDGYNYQLDIYSKDFLDNKVIGNRTKDLFNALITDLSKKQRNSINWSKTKQLFFIKDTMSFIRCKNGEIKKIYELNNRPRYSLKPAELVRNKKSYETTRQNIKFEGLHEQFKIDEDVLVFPELPKLPKQKSKFPEPVLKGKIIGHNQQQGKVRVKISDKIKGMKQDILMQYINTNQIYFTLEFTKFITGIDTSIIQTLLDSINIVTENPQLPPSIDIGLNFICRRQKRLVANLVRINFQNIHNVRDVDYKKIFKNLQISYRGIQLILEYKEKFGNVINFIIQRHEKLIEKKDPDTGKIQWNQKIFLSDMFKEQEKDKAIKSLMNVYMWLIKQKQTHLPLLSIFSKQVAIKKIKQLTEIFQADKANKANKGNKKKYQQVRQISVNPNYLFTRRLASLCNFHLPIVQKPKSHTIRDQVICLRPQFFGDYGVIVGVDEDQYQVIFQKPSFGKNDLNGLCDELYGGRFLQRELYNMDLWPQYITPRKINEKLSGLQNIGYLGKDEKAIPKTKTKAIRTHQDLWKFNETVKNKNVFSDKFLKHVKERTKEQKVQSLSPEYQTVDNKKKEYKLKYDKGQTSISDEQMKEMKKEVKYREKTAEEIVKESQIQADFKEQVIQSKEIQSKDQQTQIQKKSSLKYKPKQQQKQQSEQEDGDDILQAA